MIFFKNKQNMQRYIFPKDENCPVFSYMLKREIQKQRKNFCNLIILCIGTNKIAGDCLGPLVGTRLQALNYTHPVYGTLLHPVHAINLVCTMKEINEIYLNPFLIVIDAATGFPENVGYVSLSHSPLYPGKGINRPLQPIGNLSVKGIITSQALPVEQTLFYTHMDIVKQMADFIAKGIIGTEIA